jgi:hypothetical protein
LRYTAGTVQGNPVINSAFQVWQRGTSFTDLTGYTANCADRWNFFRGSFATGSTISRQLTNDSTNLPFIQYCARVQRTAGNTGTQSMNLSMSFESVNSIPYAGKTITISFYARKGANYSEINSNLSAGAATGTGTDQNFQSGYTGASTFLTGSYPLTTTWQRFSSTATLSANATELGFGFGYAPTGTAGANDYFEITGVQIDIGSVALPFRTYAGTIQGELAACQRYFYTNTAVDNAYAYFGTAQANSATSLNFPFTLPVQLRVAPSSAIVTGNIGAVTANGGAINNGTITIGNTGKNIIGLNMSSTSGLVAGNATIILANNSSTASISFSAEL